MDITLHLSHELGRRLEQQAAEAGRDLESFAIKTLEERLLSEPETSTQSRQSVIAEFDAWLDSFPKSDAKYVDDSREEVYRGRGE